MEFILNTGKKLQLDTIVVDLNGTLAVGGKIVSGVKPRLKKLQQKGFRIFLVTGDARGNAKKIAKELKIEVLIAKKSSEKKQAIKKINSKNIIAIGNARIDEGMFKKAKIKILTLQAEGIHAHAIKKTDIITTSINDALDLFIDEKRFLSTMKK